MRVLLLAEICNPEWPSLPVVGYKACRAIADHVDAVVATHVRNRPAIEAAGGCGKAEVVYLDNEYIASPLHKLGNVLRGGTSVNWTASVALGYPAYLAFEWEVWKRFKRDLKAGCFDLVHRVTPMTPAQPSPLAVWSQTPFVLGPLNGGLKWPREFYAEFKREREWMLYLRNAYKRLPYHRRMLARSAAILAGFRHTMDDLPPDVMARVIDFPEVGLDPDLFGRPACGAADGGVQFIFVGRLVAVKAVDVLIQAFAQSDVLRGQRLVIVGDGPERGALEELVHEKGLDGAVTFAGWKSQAEVGELLRGSDVFAFPSIKELGAGVVVEAMATGLPSVVVDYGAPGTLVGATGIVVPLTGKERMVTAFRNAMESLVHDPERRRAMGEAARARALELFAWDAKAVKTVEVYRWVLGEVPRKPSFYPESV